jgi:hypothetical protein
MLSLSGSCTYWVRTTNHRLRILCQLSGDEREVIGRDGMIFIDLLFAYSFSLQGAVFGDQEIPHALETKNIHNLRDDWSSVEKVAVNQEIA